MPPHLQHCLPASFGVEPSPHQLQAQTSSSSWPQQALQRGQQHVLQVADGRRKRGVRATPQSDRRERAALAVAAASDSENASQLWYLQAVQGPG
jgi:hypothetical protein